MVYTADISTSQQAGKYADLAWSIANYSYDSNKTVLALAGDEGKVDNNFVGTQVVVGGSYQNSVSAEVKQEKPHHWLKFLELLLNFQVLVLLLFGYLLVVLLV